jgi:hypothetical protein
MTLAIDGAFIPEIPRTVAESPSSPATPGDPAAESSPFAGLLASLGKSVDQGEGMMQGVVSGQATFADPGTLIALQAGIYRYSEAVDLLGKLVDRGGNAVRTVLHGGQ